MAVELNRRRDPPARFKSMKMPHPTVALVASLLLLAGCGTALVTSTEPGPASRPAAPRPKAYTAADALPPMPNRPPELVPGAIPARVRYRVADDATVTRLAAQLQTALAAGDPAIYGDVVMVQPGAWIYLRNDLTLDTKDAATMTMVDPGQAMDQIKNGGGYSGRMLRTPHAIGLLAPEVAKLLREDGGFRVRALATAEMTKWWPYIMFDIEEPTYVVETTGGHHHFVVGMSHDKIFSLDDLDGLPNAH